MSNYLHLQHVQYFFLNWILPFYSAVLYVKHVEVKSKFNGWYPQSQSIWERISSGCEEYVIGSCSEHAELCSSSVMSVLDIYATPEAFNKFTCLLVSINHIHHMYPTFEGYLTLFIMLMWNLNKAMNLLHYHDYYNQCIYFSLSSKPTSQMGHNFLASRVALLERDYCTAVCVDFQCYIIWTL